MKQETEKLIYSMQSDKISFRCSIQDAKDELDYLLCSLPATQGAPVMVAVQVLLNSIVAEVMATENKVDAITDEQKRINKMVARTNAMERL